MSDALDDSTSANGDTENNGISLSSHNSFLSTPSIISNSALSHYRRRRFDDRSQSRTSIHLRAHTASPGMQRPKIPSNVTLEQLQRFVKWTETKHVLKIINSTDFLTKFGTPVLIQLSQNHIAVGTSKGVIVGFNYRQEADFVLVPRKSDSQTPSEQPTSKICCVSFSSDAFYAAAGYQDGTIAVWDLDENVLTSQFDIIYADGVIEPVSLEDRFGRNSQGHLRGVPVVKVDFVGDQHQQLVSLDVSGLVFFHRGFKRFLRKYYVSQKLMGQNDCNSTDPSGKYAIHDSQMLSIGTSEQITDTLGLLAVITKNILVVVSVRSLDNPEAPHPVSHLKTTRPKSVAGDSFQGCLSWYPCIEVGKQVQNAKLAYSWNNVVTVLELENDAIPSDIHARIADLKEKNRGIPQFKFNRKGRWTVSEGENVVALNWLNSEILTAVVRRSDTTETRLLFFYCSGKNKNSMFSLVGVDDLDSQQIAFQSIQSQDGHTIAPSLPYSGSLKILRHRLVLLVNSHSASTKTLLSGRCLKWADRLMEFLAQREFESALHMAFDCYTSNNYGHLVLHGLPHDKKQRHAVVEPILKKIMAETVQPLFGPEGCNTEVNLRLMFTLASILSTKGVVGEDILDILDEIYDRFEDNDMFFEILEEYIISREIKNLSPILFKALIENYANGEKRVVLAEIICLLDLSTLNIDLALNLCKIHHLRECRIYIWNKMLQDYQAPLIASMEEMESSTGDHEDLVSVYTYMSYILTGRQYPNDSVLDLAVEEHARRSICEILFSFGPISWPKGSEMLFLPQKGNRIFPYLQFFLEFDAFETMVTLNEFFENPVLNDEAGDSLTRQYIVEALLDIYEANEELQKGTSRVHLAIFIARNYPKYYQFIRISETVLQSTVDTLCQIRDPDIHEDCELALESLLSVYDVESDAQLLEQMKAARFYDALFKIYKSQGKYTQAMEMWLAKDVEATSSEKNFTVLADMLKVTFRADSNTTEQIHLVQFIEDHYEELISLNTEDMVVLSNTFNSSLNLLVLKCQDDRLALRYLVLYFQRAPKALDSVSLPLFVRFIELRCVYERHEVKNAIVDYSDALKPFKAETKAIQEKLKLAKLYEPLAIMLSRNGDHEAAVSEIWNAVKTAQNEKASDEQKHLSIASYLELAIRTGVKAQKELLWNSIVENVVRLGENSTDQTLHDLFNETIYKCFRAIEDGEKDKSTFANVFSRVLEVAKVANVRQTLDDILTSYFFETEMHTIIVSKVNQRIYNYMDKIKQEKLLGWLVSNKQCTSCGKAMWGGDTQERHLWAWEERQKSRVLKGHLPFDSDQFADCSLYVFKCSHGYHKRCLDHLGAKYCVICSQKGEAN